MKRHLSDSEPEICDDYEECSSPDTMQISRKKRRGIIEKRRRDRINNCLVELRRLVPAAFEKQGSAKLEKAEILQMTVDHLRHLHSRDPRGFSDPYSPYGNTRAFLDYSVMGFRECASEITHYLSSVEGLDSKEPTKMRIVSHLENLLSQKELAINSAMAANSQVTMSNVTAPPLQTPISVVSMPSMSIPYAPLTPPRASPDNLSPPASFPTCMPESLPRFSVAFPIPTTPIISLAPTNGGSMPTVFHTAPSTGFRPVIQPPVSMVKPTVSISGGGLPRPMPLTVITSTANTAANKMAACIPSPISPPPDNNTQIMMLELTSSITQQPISPTKTPTNSTKTPFRPWADSIDMTINA